MWQSVKVAPWIGEKYATPNLFPFRLAILGESNYTSADNFHSQLVIECVRCHLGKNDDGNFSRFATKIKRLAFIEAVEANEFWNNVAFYNFVQELVGESARQRPTDEMWQESIPAFYEFLEEVRPQRLWVLGKANWMNLLSHVSHTQVDSHTILLPVDRGIIASYTNHPSSSFKYSDWRPVVQRLLFNVSGKSPGFAGVAVKV